MNDEDRLTEATKADDVIGIDDDIDAPQAPDTDPIMVARKVGATQASINLMSGGTITGAWAAGDSQAYRRLIMALVDVTDGATARVDRSARLINDLSAGTRNLRDQLRVALDDANNLHLEREQLTSQAARVPQLLAEITQLKADLAAAQSAPTMTADEATLRAAFKTEQRRADANGAEVEELKTKLAGYAQAATQWGGSESPGFILRKATDAARAADEAFEEAKWKEGSRYLRLANMWIGLLNAAPPSPDKDSG